MMAGNGPDPIETAQPRATTANEQVVLDLIRTAFQGGRVREGVERCIAVEYTQHNPTVGDGREAVIDFFEDLWARYPASFTYQVRHLVSSGDLVCVHAYSSVEEVREVAIFDLFRVVDGLIVEHWDAIQPFPLSSANAHPMF